jgi:hypothetical protein
MIAARINQHKQVEAPPRTTTNSSGRGRGRGRGRGGAGFSSTTNGSSDKPRQYIRIGFALKVNDAITLQSAMKDVGERVRASAGTRMTFKYSILRDTDTSTVAVDDDATWQSILEEKFSELHYL